MYCHWPEREITCWLASNLHKLLGAIKRCLSDRLISAHRCPFLDTALFNVEPDFSKRSSCRSCSKLSLIYLKEKCSGKTVRNKTPKLDYLQFTCPYSGWLEKRIAVSNLKFVTTESHLVQFADQFYWQTHFGGIERRFSCDLLCYCRQYISASLVCQASNLPIRKSLPCVHTENHKDSI